jgi:phosphoribosyl 1,2-cyclic phosphate phosphodiesterase
MKIFFLGTGSAEGLPALFCECAVCREARRRGGRDRRTRTSVLIEDCVKIDLPPDTLAHVHLYNLDLSRLPHLLFTHSHDDHFAVRELQYLSPNFAPHRRGPLNIWGTHGLIKKILPEIEHFFEEAPLCFNPLSPYREFSVGPLKVTPIPARHKEDELCLNFLVRGGRDDRVLLYATDTGWYDEPTWSYLEGRRIDAVIAECGKGRGDGAYAGHLNVHEVRRFKERLVAAGGLRADAPFWVTHIAHTGLLLHAEMTAELAPSGIAVAYDGLEVRL